jgi:hypothetical protein
MRKARHIPLDSHHNASPGLRLCDQEGCGNVGEFKAPKSRHDLREYYFFCMDHVREYNKAWDFYKGMNPEEIEESRNSDITWNRPSWPVGGWRTLLENARYFNGLDSFLKIKKQPTTLPKPVHKALNVLELTYPLTMDILKKQYKKLAKQHHPDLNPNDKRAEERLKVINHSYQVLKKFLD